MEVESVEVAIETLDHPDSSIIRENNGFTAQDNAVENPTDSNKRRVDEAPPPNNTPSKRLKSDEMD